MSRWSIMDAISKERDRQDSKWGGTPGLGRSDPDGRYIPIIGEEYGEVCEAYLEGDIANLAVKLVQTAAVCVAWLEERENQGIIVVEPSNLTPPARQGILR